MSGHVTLVRKIFWQLLLLFQVKMKMWTVGRRASRVSWPPVTSPALTPLKMHELFFLLQFPKVYSCLGLAWQLSSKEFACQCQEMRVQSLAWKDSPGEGSGNPPQYSCLGNPMDGAAWWSPVHGVAKESDMT